jgi:predicted Zn-dependent protease
MIPANYFDGQSARLHPVQLSGSDGVLTLDGGAFAKRYAYADVTMAEPSAGAPCILSFPDGARCEVEPAEHRRTLAEALGYRKSRVVQWQEQWYGALLALLLLAAGAAIVVWGIPAAAERIAASVPPALDKSIGESALRGLEARMLLPSRLSDQRIAEVQAVFHGIVPAATRTPLRLLVRSSPALNANALALPDGTIVITDGMVLHILDGSPDFTDAAKGQLAGVLAHEIGHVDGRHSVRVMARSSLMAAASAALFGDFSAVAAGVPAVLMNMRYSRVMENAADDYAIALLKRHGISPALLADLFESLDEASAYRDTDDQPAWMNKSVEYMSSHPTSNARSEHLRKAAAP